MRCWVGFIHGLHGLDGIKSHQVFYNWVRLDVQSELGQVLKSDYSAKTAIPNSINMHMRVSGTCYHINMHEFMRAMNGSV